MSKADFEHIYTAPDPRAYFRTLGALDYQIPSHGARVFTQLAEYLSEARDLDSVRLVDLCCSYGVNAALLKHDATFPELVEYYSDDSCDGLGREELVARDDAWFEARRDDNPLEIVGLDVSSAAISYALDVGLLDAGATEDLEADDPSDELASMLEETDLVTVTGGIGYITERTVGRVLDAAESPPWVAALCLRWIDFDAIAAAGEERDLVVERLDGRTFPQRRFADPTEQAYVLAELDRRGLDPTGREADGYHHADLYVMRPETEAQILSIEALLDPVAAEPARDVTS